MSPLKTLSFILVLFFSLALLAFFYPEEGIEISNTTLRFPSLSSVFTVPTKEKGEDPEAAIQRMLAETRQRRSEEHTSELQSRPHLVCRLLLEKKKKETIVE